MCGAWLSARISLDIVGECQTGGCGGCVGSRMWSLYSTCIEDDITAVNLP